MNSEADSNLENAKLYDLDKFKETVDQCGLNLVREIFSIFKTYGAEMVVIEGGVNSDYDKKPYRSLAHKLKSTSALLGATQLASLCQEVENFKDEGDPQSARFLSLYERLKQSFTAAIIRIEALIRAQEAVAR